MSVLAVGRWIQLRRVKVCRADDKRDGGSRQSSLPLHKLLTVWLWNNILSTTTQVWPPPFICKVGMYVPSAHPMSGVLAGIREYSHSIKEAACKPKKKKKTLEKQTTRWKCLRKKNGITFRCCFFFTRSKLQ